MLIGESKRLIRSVRAQGRESPNNKPLHYAYYYTGNKVCVWFTARLYTTSQLVSRFGLFPFKGSPPARACSDLERYLVAYATGGAAAAWNSESVPLNWIFYWTACVPWRPV